MLTTVAKARYHQFNEGDEGGWWIFDVQSFSDGEIA
jgi:hypothetical protein